MGMESKGYMGGKWCGGIVLERMTGYKNCRVPYAKL